MRKHEKSYFIALKKSNNDIILSTSKTEIALFIGVCETTIRRWLSKSSPYITDEYIIWEDIHVKKIRRNNGINYLNRH